MPKEPTITFKRLGKNPPKHVKCTCGASKGTDFGEWKGDMVISPANGEINIDPRQSEEELLDTLVHELLHDSMPFLEEFAVKVYGTHIATALWKQGYRRVKE